MLDVLYVLDIIYPYVNRRTYITDNVFVLLSEHQFLFLGINPDSLKGNNICVISATSLSEAEITRYTDLKGKEGISLVGHSRAMMANRISYFYGLTGKAIIAYLCN